MIPKTIIKWLKKRYKQKYKVTLAPTDENINIALRLASYGIKRKLSLYSAILERFGYRYRRLENFIRELDLWEERPKSAWVGRETEFRIFTGYIGKNETITVELVYHIYVPLPITYTTKKLDKDLAALILKDACDGAGWPLDLFKVYAGYEVLTREELWDYSEYSIVNVLLHVYKETPKKTVKYTYANRMKISNFSLFDTLIDVQPSYAFLNLEWNLVNREES